MYNLVDVSCFRMRHKNVVHQELKCMKFCWLFKNIFIFSRHGLDFVRPEVRAPGLSRFARTATLKRRPCGGGTSPALLSVTLAASTSNCTASTGPSKWEKTQLGMYSRLLRCNAAKGSCAGLVTVGPTKVLIRLVSLFRSLMIPPLLKLRTLCLAA